MFRLLTGKKTYLMAIFLFGSAAWQVSQGQQTVAQFLTSDELAQMIGACALWTIRRALEKIEKLLKKIDAKTT